MAYRNKKMLEDINGDLIPQYWDVVDQEFKPLTNDPQDVRLTGSNAEKEVIFERKIRSKSETPYHVTAPDDAIGLLLVSRVYGITGNLAENEGVRVELDNVVEAAIFNISSARSNRASVQIIDVSRYGTNLEDATIKYSSTSYKKSVYPVFGGLKFRVFLDINGEYGSNEGADSEAYIYWIKG